MASYRSDTDGHGQYTIEGEIAQIGSFARGAVERGGIAGLAARLVALVVLVLMLIAPLAIFLDLI